MADERCICHINGYRVKDPIARQSATNAGMMATAAMEKATSYEKQIAEAVTTANKAKYTADRVDVTAKAAYTAAEAAAAAAEVAAMIAEAALPKSGGTMTGDVNMNGREITNALNIQARGVYLKEPNAGYDVSIEAMTEPGVVHLFCAKNLTTGANKDGSVILRGVSAPVNDNDAATKNYVDQLFAALMQEIQNTQKERGASIARTIVSDIPENHVVSMVDGIEVTTELIEEVEENVDG